MTSYDKGQTNEAGKKICGAKKRNGEPCQNAPMDNGRCRMHGGRNINDKRLAPENPRNVPGAPVKHGKYSKYLKTTLEERYNEFVDDKEFMSLKDEMAYMRALSSRLLEKLEADDLDLDMVSSINDLTNTIRKLSDSYMRIMTQQKYALSPDEVKRIIQTVIDVIDKHVDDYDTLERIKNDMRGIRV